MNKKDFGNLVSLALIQGSNAVFPVIIFPYLFIRLSADSFSRIVVAESIAMYVLAISLYSFDIAGIKSLVECGKDSACISQAYWVALFSRLIIFVFTSVWVLFVTILWFPNSFYIILVWLMFPLGMILQSNYYFQALENNTPLSIAVIFTRLLTCGLVYLFIVDKSQDILASAFLSGSFLASGVASLIYIQRNIEFKISYFCFEKIIFQLKSGFHIFIGNFSVTLFRGSNILILSAVAATPHDVSVYGMAEKIVKSVQALLRPFNILATPKVIRKVGGTYPHVKNRKIIWKYTKVQLLLVLLMTLIFAFIILSPFDLIKKANGDSGVVELVLIMSIAIFFGVANYMFGYVGLNAIGEQKYYAKSVLMTGIVSLSLTSVAAYLYSSFGAGVMYVLGEGMLFILFIKKYSSNRYNV